MGYMKEIQLYTAPYYLPIATKSTMDQRESEHINGGYEDQVPILEKFN